jgi:hypothetical protein
MGVFLSVALSFVPRHPGAGMETIRVRKKVFTAFSPYVLFINMRLGNLFVKGQGVEPVAQIICNSF